MTRSPSPNITEHTDGSFLLTSTTPFVCEQGGRIAPLELVYETFGRLSPEKDNVILIHHALSTGAHLCASEKNPTPGWWEAMVGAGKVIDTDRFFVICINNIGSCFGSSAPGSINPETQQPYQGDFPVITLMDMAKTHQIVLDALGIDQLHAVIGNSMGGMISLAFATLMGDRLQRLILVSSCYKAYPMNIALHKIQREMIQLDATWAGGKYMEQPMRGLTLARKLGYLHYRSHEEINTRFEDAATLESYLNHNAKKHAQAFDANSYLCLTRAMDRFNATQLTGHRLAEIRAKTLVISVDSDVLFPPAQQEALHEILKKAGVATHYIAHRSDRGHDAFYNDADMGAYIQKALQKSPGIRPGVAS